LPAVALPGEVDEFPPLVALKTGMKMVAGVVRPSTVTSLKSLRSDRDTTPEAGALGEIFRLLVFEAALACAIAVSFWIERDQGFDVHTATDADCLGAESALADAEP
jgi:hypothetical protein